MVVKDTDSLSAYGTTVRAFAFDGDATKFRAWEGKTFQREGILPTSPNEGGNFEGVHGRGVRVR